MELNSLLIVLSSRIMEFLVNTMTFLPSKISSQIISDLKQINIPKTNIKEEVKVSLITTKIRLVRSIATILITSPKLELIKVKTSIS